jgi:TPR repeat protein
MKISSQESGYMAFSSSHNNRIPLATLLEWYKIRDTFFGQNYVSQNIRLALELASTCKHPDAEWLVAVCSGKEVKTGSDAKRVFSALGQNDARALFFSSASDDNIISDEDAEADLLRLERAAELGFAQAQACLGLDENRDKMDRFRWLSLSAAQDERDGWYGLGTWFFDEKNLVEARRCFEKSHRLGAVDAMCLLGELCSRYDPQRWIWWAQAARMGSKDWFLSQFCEEVQLLSPFSGNHAVVFAIGEALTGNVDFAKRTIFGERFDFENRFVSANVAMDFFNRQSRAARAAVFMWTRVGMRFKVVKDVRVLIGKLVWEARSEALYDYD